MASALAIAPLNFGSIRATGMGLLSTLLGAAALCWSAGLILERKTPFTPLPVLLALAALAASALFWLSSASHPTEATAFTNTHLAKVVARWPHSVVHFESGAVIAWHAGLGLALWMIADLSRNPAWSLAFSSVIVGTAVLVTGLALLQNQTQATGIFWRAEGRMPGRFWGSFFHHTSAGAYLNSAWPLAAGLFVALPRSSLSSAVIRWGRALAGIALILLLGAHTTHISRFPQLAALLVLPFLLWALTRLLHARNDNGQNPVYWSRSAPAAVDERTTARAPWLHAIAGLARGRGPARSQGRWLIVVLLGVVAIALGAGRLDEITQRWQLVDFSAAKTVRAIPPESEWPRLVRADLLIPNLYNAGKFSDRGEAQLTAWRAIAARPLSGHGPGNWAAAASRHTADPYVRSFYLYLQFAHEDFLQSWVEWGAAGFLSLLILLPGAVIAVFWIGFSTDPVSAAIVIGATAGLAAILLQSLIDFPLQIPAVALNATALAGLLWSGWSTRLPAPAVPLPVS